MFCPNCGNKMVSSNNYCIRCGYSLQSNTTVSNSVNVTQNSNASSKVATKNEVQPELYNAVAIGISPCP